MTDLVRMERDRGVARVTLNRPEFNNALDEHLIEALSLSFAAIVADTSIMTVVLSGEGKSLCAGADINWMRRAAAYSREESIADLMPLGRMLEALDRMPQTTIGRVHGPIYGGGVGVVAACDIAIGSSEFDVLLVRGQTRDCSGHDQSVGAACDRRARSAALFSDR